jgi:hypothetical protein
MVKKTLIGYKSLMKGYSGCNKKVKETLRSRIEVTWKKYKYTSRSLFSQESVLSEELDFPSSLHHYEKKIVDNRVYHKYTHTHSLNIYLMKIFWSIGEFEVESEATKKVRRKRECFGAVKR